MKTLDLNFYPLKMSIKYNGVWKAIVFKDIICLKASGNYTEITIYTNKQYYVLYSLDKFEKKLPVGFFRCHRSAIINLKYIHKIEKNRLFLSNEINLPISLSKIALLENKLSELPSLTLPICDYCEICPTYAKCPLIRPFKIDSYD